MGYFSGGLSEELLQSGRTLTPGRKSIVENAVLESASCNREIPITKEAHIVGLKDIPKDSTISHTAEVFEAL